MYRVSYAKYVLRFREPSGTSRGVLTEKETYFFRVEDKDGVAGIGECPLFRGLSAEDRPDYEEKLREVCREVREGREPDLENWSSIRFGVETALADLKSKGRGWYFPSPFMLGEGSIRINGLIWMGDSHRMRQRIREKIEAGFHCIKLKIGALDFEEELGLLRAIRQQFSREDIELRVDANGAFSPEEAPRKLEALARYDLHSIEQPIRRGQWEALTRLCRNTPVPVALDEELIGVNEIKRKIELLEIIRPQYIILKPALAGGFRGAEEWIRLAEEREVGWWITSALESNIGLSALAQWTARLKNPLPQGLGTGRLYTNNFPCGLRQEGERLFYPVGGWDRLHTPEINSRLEFCYPGEEDRVYRQKNGDAWK